MIKMKFTILDSPEIIKGVALSSYKNSLLFMNPSDVETLKFVKNQPVLLTSDEKKMLFKLSPCTSVPPSSVVLSSFSLFNINLKNSVTVEVFNQLIDYADKMILIFERYKSFMESKNFRRYLSTVLNKLYLTEDLILCISYLGYTCHCVVKKLIGSEEEIVNRENRNDESLIFKDSTFENSFICSTPKDSKTSKHLLPESIKYVNNKSINDPSKQFYVVHEKTKILLEKVKDTVLSSHISFQDLCGLEEQIKSIKTLINSFLNQSYKDYRSMKTHHGIILIGPTGTGKSITVQALENEFNLPVINLNNVTFTRNKEELRVQLQNLFKKAEDNAPSILFLDNIDTFCKDQSISSSLSRSATAQILSAMVHHLLNSRSDVIVIAAVRNISLLEPSLRKPGLLETEIYFSAPSVADRKEIMCKILSEVSHLLSQEQISEIAEVTHGYTGGDLKLLCDKSIIFSQLRANYFCSYVQFEDLKEALKVVKPSAMAEFKFEVPKIKWNDIGGMDAVKQTITEMVDLKFTEKLKKWKMPTHKGVLLYGPPGCAKTMIAAALASETHFNFISIKGPELFRKYVGESENAMAQLFLKARAAAPCIVFFDEIDSMSSIRGSTSGNSNVADRLLNQLLVTIDGIDVLESPVHIIAATNRPEIIDESILRPGRFDKLIYVPLPDSATRKEIIENCVRNLPVDEDINIPELVEATEGYTGAEIVEVCDEATSSSLEDSIRSHISVQDLHTVVVTRNHFEIALTHVKPKITKEMLKSYEMFQIQRKCNIFYSQSDS